MPLAGVRPKRLCAGFRLVSWANLKKSADCTSYEWADTIMDGEGGRKDIPDDAEEVATPIRVSGTRACPDSSLRSHPGRISPSYRILPFHANMMLFFFVDRKSAYIFRSCTKDKVLSRASLDLDEKQNVNEMGCLSPGCRSPRACIQRQCDLDGGV
jgi:hypothetical protein